MKSTALARVLAVVLSLGFAPTLATAQVKPADAIRYRHAAFQVVVWNFMPMSAMARGKLPFDAVKFGLHAERVAAMAPQLLEGFPAGSGSGAETEAKPEIWTQWADFEGKMKALETESRALATLCKSADEAAIKTQFGKVGAACKACHDQYKKD